MTVESGKRATVLYIDVEGGFGGSSLSLYHFLRGMDHNRYKPTVWYRSSGPMEARLDGLGIASEHRSDIYHLTPVEKSNWKNFLATFPRFLKIRAFVADLIKANPDVLHLNHVGLAPVIAYLRLKKWRGKIVVHVRSQFPKNWVSRLYCKILNNWADFVIFISENELNLSIQNGFDPSSNYYRVIYNPAPREMLDLSVDASSLQDKVQIVFLGTLSKLKGPDRLVELARELVANSTPAVLNVYGGSPRQVGKMNELDRLRDIAKKEGLESTIRFHGHCDTPAEKLAQADLLIRTSRGNDPWGRDIIEAMACGVPVLATGSFDGFIEDGKTGFLLGEWNAREAAATIAALCENPTRILEMKAQARSRAQRLFSPDHHQRLVLDVYGQLLKT
ncbi:MAG: glycosyltransferase family 4 protein [Rhizobiaceae bacterium]